MGGLFHFFTQKGGGLLERGAEKRDYGNKTLAVAGKLEQLQLTALTFSKGVTQISSVSGITAATPLVFADNI